MYGMEAQGSTPRSMARYAWLKMPMKAGPRVITYVQDVAWRKKRDKEGAAVNYHIGTGQLSRHDFLSLGRDMNGLEVYNFLPIIPLTRRRPHKRVVWIRGFRYNMDQSHNPP